MVEESEQSDGDMPLDLVGEWEVRVRALDAAVQTGVAANYSPQAIIITAAMYEAYLWSGVVPKIEEPARRMKPKLVD